MAVEKLAPRPPWPSPLLLQAFSSFFPLAFWKQWQQQKQRAVETEAEAEPRAEAENDARHHYPPSSTFSILFFADVRILSKDEGCTTTSTQPSSSS